MTNLSKPIEENILREEINDTKPEVKRPIDVVAGLQLDAKFRIFDPETNKTLIQGRA
jgi:hypothetical protein